MNFTNRLLTGVAAGVVATAVFAPFANAQTHLTPSAGKDDRAEEVEEIVITGSRIRRTGTDTPTPTTILNSEVIEQSGVTEIADLVNQIPSLFVTQTNQTSNQLGNAGLNALDLRGLGTDRTLVLVNGRRRVPAMPGSSAVDVSAIPTGLVQRVEVITGGASALYGADAVAGVANFILKSDFEGLELNTMYSDSSRGDMPGYSADLLWGRNFADGRGNVTAFGAYSGQNGIVVGQDRPWTAQGTPRYRLTNGSYVLTDGNRNVYDLNTAVVQLGGRTNLFTFNSDGTARPLVLGPGGILNASSTQADLGSFLTDGGELLGRYDDWALVVPSERYTASVSSNYALSDNIKLFGDVTYSHTDSKGLYRAYNAYGYDVLFAGNPFITPQMTALNGGAIGDLSFARRFTEFGRQETRYGRAMYQLTAGAEGKTTLFGGRDWNWAAHYSYGQTQQEVQVINATAVDRYFLALDAVRAPGGAITCRSTLTDPTNGCVPLNPFMTVPQSVIDYLQYDTTPTKERLRQHVFSAYATGDIFDLPAGAVQGVLGVEYRKESNNISATPQYDPTNPQFDPTIGITQSGLVGDYSVGEVFGELRVPLLANLPFAEELSFEGAVRYSDYSTAGETTAYKAALNWRPIPDIRFRSTYGQAVRAPNISELYTSAQIGGAWLADPCNYYDVVNRVSRTASTAPNCKTIAPANKNTYWQWLDVIYSGNEDLKVETATTYTVGVALKPRFIPNLSLTVDYFDIQLEDAIDSFGAQTIMNKCVDAASLDNQFCALVNRDPTTHNLISVNVQQLNLSQFATRGIDFEANYWFYLNALGLGQNSGTLSINAVYTQLLERSFILDPTDVSTQSDTVGLFGSPEWKGAIRTTYNNGPWTLNWTVRHVSPMRPGSNVTADRYDVPETDNVFYHDIYGSFAVNQRVSVYGGLRNAFDEEPPRLPGAEAGGANFEYGYQAGNFDVIGRTFYVGLRLRH